MNIHMHIIHTYIYRQIVILQRSDYWKTRILRRCNAIFMFDPRLLPFQVNKDIIYYIITISDFLFKFHIREKERNINNILELIVQSQLNLCFFAHLKIQLIVLSKKYSHNDNNILSLIKLTCLHHYKQS